MSNVTMRLWIVSLLLAATLAGCADDASEQPAGMQLGDGSTVHLDDVKTRDGYGAVSGVVVDEAIRPIEGAVITYSGGPEVISGPDGRFVLNDLSPGLLVLSAQADGHEASQASATIVEGEVAIVKIMLMTDRSPQPYHTTYKFDAFVDGSVGLANWGVDLFAGDIVPTCQCAFNFSVDQAPAGFVLEAVWEDSISGKPTGPTEYYFSLISDEPFELDTTYVTNPAHWVVDGSVFPAEARDYTVSLYPDDVWPAYNQNYEIFVTVFYLEPPAAGWSALDPSPVN